MTYERRSGEALRLVLKEMVQPPSPNLPQGVLGQVRAAANPAFSSTSPRITWPLRRSLLLGATAAIPLVSGLLYLIRRRWRSAVDGCSER